MHKLAIFAYWEESIMYNIEQTGHSWLGVVVKEMLQPTMGQCVMCWRDAHHAWSTRKSEKDIPFGL